MKFTVFIDESGQSGISKIRTGNTPGASQYLVLGAVVCTPTTEVLLKNMLMEFRETIGKSRWKHATDLNHAEKVFLGREMGRMPVRLFALISNKSTLESYKRDINYNPQKFYNKCVKYLLENVFSYLSPRLTSDLDVRIVFEKMNHDYSAMMNFLEKVKRNPIYPQSAALQYLNTFSIVTKKKGQEPILDAADFVAHAVFQCVNHSEKNFNIPEPRYLREMSSRFAGGGDGKALGVGLKCLHSLEKIGVDPDIEEFFRSIEVKPASS